jgi:transposase
VFFGKRRSALKILFADRTGMCLFCKRLDAGTLRVPDATADGAESVVLDERSLDDLLDGVDVHAPERMRPARTPRMH